MALYIAYAVEAQRHNALFETNFKSQTMEMRGAFSHADITENSRATIVG